MPDICSTCLSQNRALKPLELLRKVNTLEWLHIDFLPPSCVLCWECVEDLRRADRFRQRAIGAQHALKEQLPLTSLSTLVKTEICREDYIHSEADEILEKIKNNNRISLTSTKNKNVESRKDDKKCQIDIVKFEDTTAIPDVQCQIETMLEKLNRMETSNVKLYSIIEVTEPIPKTTVPEPHTPNVILNYTEANHHGLATNEEFDTSEPVLHYNIMEPIVEITEPNVVMVQSDYNFIEPDNGKAKSLLSEPSFGETQHLTTVEPNIEKNKVYVNRIRKINQAANSPGKTVAVAEPNVNINESITANTEPNVTITEPIDPNEPNFNTTENIDIFKPNVSITKPIIVKTEQNPNESIDISETTVSDPIIEPSETSNVGKLSTEYKEFVYKNTKEVIENVLYKNTQECDGWPVLTVSGVTNVVPEETKVVPMMQINPLQTVNLYLREKSAQNIKVKSRTPMFENDNLLMPGGKKILKKPVPVRHASNKFADDLLRVYDRKPTTMTSQETLKTPDEIKRQTKKAYNADDLIRVYDRKPTTITSQKTLITPNIMGNEIKQPIKKGLNINAKDMLIVYDKKPTAITSQETLKKNSFVVNEINRKAFLANADGIRVFDRKSKPIIQQDTLKASKEVYRVNTDSPLGLPLGSLIYVEDPINNQFIRNEVKRDSEEKPMNDAQNISKTLQGTPKSSSWVIKNVFSLKNKEIPLIKDSQALKKPTDTIIKALLEKSKKKIVASDIKFTVLDNIAREVTNESPNNNNENNEDENIDFIVIPREKIKLTHDSDEDIVQDDDGDGIDTSTDTAGDAHVISDDPDEMQELTVIPQKTHKSTTHSCDKIQAAAINSKEMEIEISDTEEIVQDNATISQAKATSDTVNTIGKIKPVPLPILQPLNKLKASNVIDIKKDKIVNKTQHLENVIAYNVSRVNNSLSRVAKQHKKSDRPSLEKEPLTHINANNSETISATNVDTISTDKYIKVTIETDASTNETSSKTSDKATHNTEETSKKRKNTCKDEVFTEVLPKRNKLDKEEGLNNIDKVQNENDNITELSETTTTNQMLDKEKIITESRERLRSSKKDKIDVDETVPVTPEISKETIKIEKRKTVEDNEPCVQVTSKRNKRTKNSKNSKPDVIETNEPNKEIDLLNESPNKTNMRNTNLLDSKSPKNSRKIKKENDVKVDQLGFSKVLTIDRIKDDSEAESSSNSKKKSLRSFERKERTEQSKIENSKGSPKKIKTESVISDVSEKSRKNKGSCNTDKPDPVSNKPQTSKNNQKLETKKNKVKLEDDIKIAIKDSSSKNDEPPYKLVYISNEEMYRNREMDRLDEDYIRKPFKCEPCIQSFISNDLLTEHVRRYHSEKAGPYLCSVCTKRFTKEQTLSYHYRTHQISHLCSKCCFKHHIEDVVKKHVQDMHELHKCQFCEMQFQTADELSEHVLDGHMSRKELRRHRQRPLQEGGPRQV